MKAAYLEKLNDRQREAFEHGIGLADGAIRGPLLIIAGAASGKTKSAEAAKALNESEL